MRTKVSEKTLGEMFDEVTEYAIKHPTVNTLTVYEALQALIAQGAVMQLGEDMNTISSFAVQHLVTVSIEEDDTFYYWMFITPKGNSVQYRMRKTFHLDRDGTPIYYAEALTDKEVQFEG